MEIKKLNKYTSLPVLLDVLYKKRIVLLDPVSWEDRNDSLLIFEYSRIKDKKVFVSCFSYGMETIHHWKNYANGISGCCIEFIPNKIFEIVDRIEGIRRRKVIYKKIDKLEKEKRIYINKMPFYKRWPYRCEEEYRIIWEGNTDDNKVEIEIPINTIRRITINQEMPKAVFDSIKEILKSNDENINKVVRSSLYENDRWLNHFRKKSTSPSLARSMLKKPPKSIA